MSAGADGAGEESSPGMPSSAGVGSGQARADEADSDTALSGFDGPGRGDVVDGRAADPGCRVGDGAVPRAQGVGVTCCARSARIVSDTVVASADFVRVVDDVRYTLTKGPCLTAPAERRTVMSGALESDPLWPRFGPRVTPR